MVTARSLWRRRSAQVGSRTPVPTSARTQQAEHDAVDDERREAAAGQVAQQPGDDAEPDAEGDARWPGSSAPTPPARRRRRPSAPRRPRRGPSRGRRGWRAGTSTGRRPRGCSPRNRPAVIVPPERETPGDQRHRLGEPEDDAVADGEVARSSRFLRADPVGPVEDQREDDQRDRDDPQVAQGGLDRVLEQQPEDDDRDAADDDQPAHPGVGVALRGGRCSEPQPGAR